MNGVFLASGKKISGRFRVEEERKQNNLGVGVRMISFSKGGKEGFEMIYFGHAQPSFLCVHAPVIVRELVFPSWHQLLSLTVGDFVGCSNILLLNVKQYPKHRIFAIIIT